MDTHVRGLEYYERGWVEPTVQAATDGDVISTDDWKTVKQEFPHMVFPYFDGYLLAGNPANSLPVDEKMKLTEDQRTMQTKFSVNLIKYFAICAQVAQQVKADKPIEFVMVDAEGHPTTCGAAAIDPVTKEETEGQRAFIGELNRAFGLDGKGTTTEATRKGTEKFKLYQRGEKTGMLYTVAGVDGKVKMEFLVDEATPGFGLQSERAIVYVRLPGLKLTMPQERQPEERKPA
jgi:hypothetical protein